jgi:chromatin remodeling complex protein RSC6
MAKANRRRRCRSAATRSASRGQTDTLEQLFGSAPMPPSQMTKKLWEFVKRHKLATKG